MIVPLSNWFPHAIFMSWPNAQIYFVHLSWRLVVAKFDTLSECNISVFRHETEWYEYYDWKGAMIWDNNLSQVAVSMRIKSLMDINEVRTSNEIFGKKCNNFQVDGFFQVQFYLTMKWFESRLKFQVVLTKTIKNKNPF